MNILAITLVGLLAQNASIQGIVVRGIREPLSKAVVELRTDGPDAAVLSSATTEDDGQFRFQTVRPGRYRVTVKRQGYTRPPLTITLAAGQQLSDLRLNMTPTGAIYGRILDGNGIPLGNIEVQALKPSYPEGRRALTLFQTVRTNDLGEYRLFWLPAGRYYVVALHDKAQDPRRPLRFGAGGMMIGGGMFFASAASADPALGNPYPDKEDVLPETEGYIPVYFPGTIHERNATAVDLRPGADFGSVNIVVDPVHRRRVRGVVIDGSTGKPAEYATVEITDNPRNEFIQADPDNGSFEIDLFPGRHDLTANARNGSGSVDIQLGNVDIPNLTIVTGPSFDVRAGISSDSGTLSNSDLDSLRISLRRDPPPPTSIAQRAGFASQPLPDGSFALDATAGNYRVQVANLPASPHNMYLKSIRLGAVDVLNNGLRLERPPADRLEIVLGTNPGSVEGSALAADVSVVLVPDVRHRVDLYRATISDPAGRFRFDAVAPGGYKLFAWREVETGIWHDSEFLRNYENRGTAIRVGEGSKQNVQISAIE